MRLGLYGRPFCLDFYFLLHPLRQKPLWGSLENSRLAPCESSASWCFFVPDLLAADGARLHSCTLYKKRRDDLDEVLNRIMVPAESSAPTFEDTLAASENLFEKTCEILGIPKTETQILAEDDTGMLIPRPAAPRCLDRTYERIAEQDIAAVDTRLPKEQLSDVLETSGGGIGSGFHA